MSSNKCILLDTETTGVDLLKNDMYQIAGFVIVDDKVIETFDIKFQPPKDTTFSPGALEKTRMKIEDYFKFQANATGMLEFVTVLDKYVNRFEAEDKFHLIAYNAHFDANFIRKWMNQYKKQKIYYGSYFWANNIDIMSMASEFLKGIRHKMPNFKLQTVHRTLCAIGLLKQPESYKGTHDALFDIQIEWDIYNLFRTENICNTLNKINELKKGK